MKFSKEAKIGLLVTVALVALIWGINFLKGKDFFTTSNKYYAVYDNVQGLVKSNPVTMSGYRIGIINSIDFLPDKSGRLVVSMLIDNDVFITRDAVASIVSSDLLGAKAMRIDLGVSPEKAGDGDTLAGSVETSLTSKLGEQVGPVKDKVESLIVSIDSISHVLLHVFDVNTQNNIKSSMMHLNSSMGALDHMLNDDNGRLKMMLANLETITYNIRKHNEEIGHILSNASTLSDSLAKARFASAVNNADLAMVQFNNLMEKINKGEGSLGLLVNDKQLYNHLDETSRHLDDLLKDLKANPKRYVHFSMFGKKEK